MRSGSYRKGVLSRYRRKAKFDKRSREVYNYLVDLLKDPCPYCQEYGCDTFDHIIPKSEGGHAGWTNLTPCHYACNKKKGSKGVISV